MFCVTIVSVSFYFADSENVLNGNAMTASSKITAINLVAELLRKVNVSVAFSCQFLLCFWWVLVLVLLTKQ